ncbi:hypothetical protein EG328_004949 [Venturia inaequalis]|uniref:Uncharacterized protein n=1 Tax=Venturia inaequalis TaxID=5025 RepID=A0A8H3YWL4_VENIN|nr:hypothetical protein EG328_004949 [Venturia inaequalis]KAE9994278.1 hypothetical protein EG327_000123 [Venturia inaequalis]RDI81953.1 hypothetical protein Vi05172_g8104 [Venturia inaequalis]
MSGCPRNALSKPGTFTQVQDKYSPIQEVHASQDVRHSRGHDGGSGQVFLLSGLEKLARRDLPFMSPSNKYLTVLRPPLLYAVEKDLETWRSVLRRAHTLGQEDTPGATS